MLTADGARVWCCSAESITKKFGRRWFPPGDGPAMRNVLRRIGNGANIADSDAPDKTEKSTALAKRRK
jgi:hypothetical protein